MSNAASPCPPRDFQLISYECADGSCVILPHLCGIDTTQCPLSHMKRCPYGDCVPDDQHCMRRCGKVANAILYNTTCHEVASSTKYAGLCVANSSHCPQPCPTGYYMCHYQKCRQTELHCEDCPEYSSIRCPGSKSCYAPGDRCDGYNDCPGGQDEANCQVIINGDNTSSIPLTSYAMIGGAVVCALVACCLLYRRYRKRATRGGTTSTGRQRASVVVSGTTPNQLGVPHLATPTTPTTGDPYAPPSFSSLQLSYENERALENEHGPSSAPSYPSGSSLNYDTVPCPVPGASPWPTDELPPSYESVVLDNKPG